MTSRSLYQFGIVMMTAPLAGLLVTFAPRAGADDTEFKPIVEAKMPEDFPQYTPVRDVQIKRYPAYRKAEADPNAGRAFWTLFFHIKKNDIAMTAPVEMSYADGQSPREGMAASWSHNGCSCLSRKRTHLDTVGTAHEDGLEVGLDAVPTRTINCHLRLKLRGTKINQDS